MLWIDEVDIVGIFFGGGGEANKNRELTVNRQSPIVKAEGKLHVTLRA